jgi:hypothetical protein
MVRREEQHWRNTASLFLDTRRTAYSTAMFEFAVSAAASIGVHLAGEGFDTRFVTAEGEVPAQGSFRDTLLDTLAVVRPSRSVSIEAGVQALNTAGGQIMAVIGDVPADQARKLAAARRGAAGVAIVLADEGTSPEAARVLAGSGWRVAVAHDAARLTAAWQQLQGVSRPDGPGVPGGLALVDAHAGDGVMVDGNAVDGPAADGGPAREAAHG